MRANLIYLTYNAAEDIPHLRSLIANAGEVLPVIAIDNCSNDGSADALRELGLDVTEPDDNLGFTAGINAGLYQCGAEWAVIANPDVRVLEAGWLDKLLNVPPECGIVGARLHQGAMVMGGGSVMEVPASVIRQAAHDALGGQVLCDELLGWSRMTQHTGGPTDNLSPMEMPWVAFALCALRMDMVREIGFLDERFWHFYSDNEMCLRAWANEWTVWYQPVTFGHEGSAALKFAPEYVIQRTRDDVTRWCNEERIHLTRAKLA